MKFYLLLLCFLSVKAIVTPCDNPDFERNHDLAICTCKKGTVLDINGWCLPLKSLKIVNPDGITIPLPNYKVMYSEYRLLLCSAWGVLEDTN